MPSERVTPPDLRLALDAWRTVLVENDKLREQLAQAFEAGRQQGMAQERALWMLSRWSQDNGESL